MQIVEVFCYFSFITPFRLPALPFDDMQLFFIGYALPWCARHTKKHSQSQVIDNSNCHFWLFSYPTKHEKILPIPSQNHPPPAQPN